METALSHPDKVHSVVSLDIAALRYAPRDRPILDAFLKADFSRIKTAGDANRYFLSEGIDSAASAFLVRKFRMQGTGYMPIIRGPSIRRSRTFLLKFTQNRI